jgi:type I restriction enzyme, S subunit
MWKTVKLGDFCELVYGKALDESDRVESDGFPAYGANGVKTFSNKALYEKPSIIIGRKGSAGEINKVSEPFWALDVTYFVKIDESSIDLDFLFYSLTTLNLPSMARGVKPGINRNDVYEKQIQLPPLAEQQRIVEKLDRAFEEIDRAIEATEHRIKNIESLYSCALSEFFEPCSGVWETKSLREVTKKIGSGATPRGGQSSYKEEGISLIRSMNVYDNLFFHKDLAKIDEEQALKLSNVEVFENDVLLNITGASVARCCLVDSSVLPARVNQHVSIIRLKENTLLPRLLCYGLISKKYKDILLGVGNSAGATRQAITKAQIEDFIFTYPVDEITQIDICEKIEFLTEQKSLAISAYQKIISSYQALKSAILAQELKGPES